EGYGKFCAGLIGLWIGNNMRSLRLIIFAVICQCAWAVGEEVVASGLRFSIDHYADGTPKVQLTAEKAAVPPAGDILIEGAVVEFYRMDGSVDGRIIAGDCVLSRDNKTAYSDSPVTVQRHGITITGKGFEWDGNEMIVRIKSKAKVVLSKQSSGGVGFAGIGLPSIGGQKGKR
ncbi:MAG: LPS export ABC transporter periplasmic protein LptC, partial [Lentisphaerae bacterium]|nr:LPS export ABC transporter periplasmic protein LptC [Lentisphaerota bacterium]